MTIVTLGSMTPPVGIAMFTICRLLDTPIEEYLKESLPFFLAVRRQSISEIARFLVARVPVRFPFEIMRQRSDAASGVSGWSVS
ncbi:TRAP transporter large permease subunit, partial [Tropicimonas sp. IMCC6043]|uniref:TRAP transporter large permease subunit n=1 Tax=Tropicimonas sp. IMCC6043 TaxID=2510645 RepID=UPI00352EE5C3